MPMHERTAACRLTLPGLRLPRPGQRDRVARRGVGRDVLAAGDHQVALELRKVPADEPAARP